jgi:hypothetical protein
MAKNTNDLTRELLIAKKNRLTKHVHRRENSKDGGSELTKRISTFINVSIAVATI